MKLWSRVKKGQGELPLVLQRQLLRLNNGLIQFARLLGERSGRYSTRSQKVFLLVFVAVFISASVAVAIEGFRGNSARNTLAKETIRTIPIQVRNPPPPVVSREEFLRLQQFKLFMDSLTRSPEGKKRREDLLCGRPGLVDSVEMLIRFYLEQTK